MNEAPLMSNVIKGKQAKGYVGQWPTFTVNIK